MSQCGLRTQHFWGGDASPSSLERDSRGNNSLFLSGTEPRSVCLTHDFIPTPGEDLVGKYITAWLICHLPPQGRTSHSPELQVSQSSGSCRFCAGLRQEARMTSPPWIVGNVPCAKQTVLTVGKIMSLMPMGYLGTFERKKQVHCNTSNVDILFCSAILSVALIFHCGGNTVQELSKRSSGVPCWVFFSRWGSGERWDPVVLGAGNCLLKQRAVCPCLRHSCQQLVPVSSLLGATEMKKRKKLRPLPYWLQSRGYYLHSSGTPDIATKGCFQDAWINNTQAHLQLV